MANPNNSFGTNGAYGGRTSVEAFNDVLSVFSGRGVLSGWGLATAGGMSVNIGGDGENRDVAIAVDNAGNKTTINNISKQPITITIPAAPASGSRTDNIVAYVNKPVQVDETTLDNPSAVNVLITSASADSAIRSAITADGGTGANAYYVILGSVNVLSGTTDITADMLVDGDLATMANNKVEKAYIWMGKGQPNFTIPQSNTRYALSNFWLIKNVGGKFTYNGNGGIVVGAGVKRVRVYYELGYQTTQDGSGRALFYIALNGTDRTQNPVYPYGATGRQYQISGTALFDVEAGDVITLAVYGVAGNVVSGWGDNGFQRPFIVEQVE